VTKTITGRGAVSNVGSRYIVRQTGAIDDGWGIDPELDSSALVTTVLPDRTKTLITRNVSPDLPFDRSINPYKGCEHGCIYCFARPTHAFLDLSPGLDFETRLFYKTDVRTHLEEELCKRSYTVAPIALGTNTDPYQPIERERRVTRTILEVLLECRHPVSLVTKSQGVLRDLDLWSALGLQGLAKVYVSITTLRRELKTKLEPRTASGEARLRVVKALAEAGVPTGVMVAPVIPFVNDSEMEDIVAAAAQAGAVSAGYILLRLPLEVKVLFSEWLEYHHPDLKDRVLNAIRSTRGGELYKSGFGERMRGEGPIAEVLLKRFEIAVRKHGLDGNRLTPLRTDLFRPPFRQASLF
jgi:DNA repair photolyase